MPENDRPGDDAYQARRYAAGALDPAAAAEFERRLADDQAARDALCAAVRAGRAVAGLPEPVPDPAYRARVLRRLADNGPWRKPGLRPYRGHPGLWALAGAAAAAVALTWLPGRPAADPAPASEFPPALAQDAARPPAAACDEVAEDGEEGAELMGGRHLAQTLSEENRRKGRAGERRLVRLEDQAAPLHPAPEVQQ